MSAPCGKLHLTETGTDPSYSVISGPTPTTIELSPTKKTDCPEDSLEMNWKSSITPYASCCKSYYPFGCHFSYPLEDTTSDCPSDNTASATPHVDAPVSSAMSSPSWEGVAPLTTNPSGIPAVTTNGQSAFPTRTPAPKPNSAAIAGGVAGGIVGLALLVGLLAICCRRRATKPRQDIDETRSPTWGLGQARSNQPDDAELEEIKQGSSLTTSPLRPSPPPPSPLFSPLPPPPVYTPYESYSNKRDRSPDHFHPLAGSPYAPYDVPSPESPPSPPPLSSRLSQHSRNSCSDEQNVSPISSHYQHQPFDNSRGLESGVNLEVSSRD